MGGDATVREEDCLDGRTDDSPRSVGAAACAPEPNTHCNSDGGLDDDRPEDGEFSRRSKGWPTEKSSMLLRERKRPNVQ